MDIKESKELLDGLKLLAKAGKKIAADGKVGLDDLSHLIDLSKDLDKLVASFKGLDKLDDELKDLDEAEIMELVSKMFSIFKEIKES